MTEEQDLKDNISNVKKIVTLIVSGIPLIGTIITGTLWMESRYQKAEIAQCLSEKVVFAQEYGENEIRLEFYNDELVLLTSEGNLNQFKQRRVKYLDDSVARLETRQREVFTLMQGKQC